MSSLDSSEDIHAAKAAKTSSLTPALLARLQNKGIVSTSSSALPPGWAEAVDPNYNRTYYYNANTGESVWERPAPSHGDLAEQAPERSNDPSRRTSDLPLNAKAFFPTDQWTGRRPGYAFKKGPLGLGYYRDDAIGYDAVKREVAELDRQLARQDSLQRDTERDVIALERMQQGGAREGGGRSGGGFQGRGGRDGGRGRGFQGGRGGRGAYSGRDGGGYQGRGGGFGGRGGRGGPPKRQEIDPMDPSSYSDAPATGKWATGLEKAQERD